MILVDENIEQEIILLLQEININYLSIRDNFPSIPDFEIIRKSNELKAIILTNDKDFGEWFFAYKMKGTGVIFLRFDDDEIKEIIAVLKNLLIEGDKKYERKFVTVTTKKIRIREI